MENKACKKCGLIQMYDVIWGLVFCDAKEAFLFGCPPKEAILEKFPNSEYDESKIIQQPITRPFLL